MTNNKLLQRLFPFISWFPISGAILRADLIAGITGALVLVPKAMAYAQLSGLPVYFGLYTAFIPALLGALWGSSRQLATGPVAIISLMTAAAVTPLAVPFSDDYIALALLLTLMVGVIQLSLGAIKLGTIVNFVSHPVILGFMNAAAIIIGLSQIDMLLGIPKGRSDSFLADIWEMLGHVPQTHLPTLAMSAFALALMLLLKKIPLLSKPSVLVAVVITTLVSYAIEFENKTSGLPDHIADPSSRSIVAAYAQTESEVRTLVANSTAKSKQLRESEKSADRRAVTGLRHEIELMKLDIASLEDQNKKRMQSIRRLDFERARADDNQAATLYLAGTVPSGTETDGFHWHIKKIEKGTVHLVGGGDVVGVIPEGLPSIRMPVLGFDAISQLLTAALVIALVAFMESVSMAKAMATKTKERIDPNQELIGQGLSNVGGAFFQAYPACGSFTGSAINLQAGAKTGLAMVFNGVFVALTLLFLTPYLYFLPKAVLAVIILLAVTGLVTPKALKHAWQANRHDGIAAAVTFFATLGFAPHLDKGIMIGGCLAIVLYLMRTMKPRVALLGRHPDGNLRDLAVHPDLPHSESVIALRFDGRLYFANVPYFEDAVLEAVAANPKARALLIVGDAINELDASGEDVVHQVVDRLRSANVQVHFCGLKKQVRDVMAATALDRHIGPEFLHANEDAALDAIGKVLGADAVAPLRATGTARERAEDRPEPAGRPAVQAGNRPLRPAFRPGRL